MSYNFPTLPRARTQTRLDSKAYYPSSKSTCTDMFHLQTQSSAREYRIMITQDKLATEQFGLSAEQHRVL
jgi:hypothetical protein